jgi:hypothetical protein
MARPFLAIIIVNAMTNIDIISLDLEVCFLWIEKRQ